MWKPLRPPTPRPLPLPRPARPALFLPLTMPQREKADGIRVPTSVTVGYEEIHFKVSQRETLF